MALVLLWHVHDYVAKSLSSAIQQLKIFLRMIFISTPDRQRNARKYL